MKSEFEEKQFEQALNLALIKNQKLIYVPGQVLENTLGFDSALFTSNWDFWKNFSEHEKLHKYRFFRHFHHAFGILPKGRILHTEFWEELDKEFNNEDFFPKIKFNAFIQHKRPEYLNSEKAMEWKSWNNPYFRYNITPHQQKALIDLEEKISTQGVVVYASPAFYRLHELWDSINNNKLISNTNFCQVSKLKHHKKYTYKDSGNIGIGHSKPEKVDSINFIEYIQDFSNKKQEMTNKKMILNLAEEISSTMEINEMFNTIFHKIINHDINPNSTQLELALKKINTFSFLTNSTYFIGY